MKRGYFVYPEDEFWGVGVVAPSAKDAKKLAFTSGELPDVDWIDIRVQWKRDSDVSNQPIGVIHDPTLALLAGVLDYLEDCTCDDCGEETLLKAYNGKALCDECIEKEYAKEAKND